MDIDVEREDELIETTYSNKLQRLLYLSAILSTFNERRERIHHYNKWCHELKQLKICYAHKICFVLKTDTSVAFSTDVLLHDHHAFLKKNSRLAEDELSRVLGKHLGIKADDIKTAMTIQNYAHAEQEQWLSDNRYDIHALYDAHTYTLNPVLATITEPAQKSDGTDSVVAIPSRNPTTTDQPTHENNASTQEARSDHQSELPHPTSANANAVIPADRIDLGSVCVSSLSHTKAIRPQPSGAIALAPATSEDKTPMTKRIASKKGTRNNCWSGIWGERLVFRKLNQHYRKKYPNARLEKTDTGFKLTGANLELCVDWKNLKGESGLPVDIVITKNGIKRYVEVKTTTNSKKMFLCITPREWGLLKKKGNRYRFFCVFGAGNASDYHIKKIKNPYHKLITGAFGPYEAKIKLKL